MKSILYKFLPILFLVLLPWFAAAAPVVNPQNKGPVEVSADRLEFNDDAKLLVFTGNAVATQNDVTIHGDRLTVKYVGENREIEQVVAEGDVRIIQADRIATGAKAILFRADGRVVLTGNPKVTQGDNFVQGQEITIFLNDKRSVVSGGSGGRVNAVFTPRAEGKP